MELPTLHPQTATFLLLLPASRAEPVPSPSDPPHSGRGPGAALLSSSPTIL